MREVTDIPLTTGFGALALVVAYGATSLGATQPHAAAVRTTPWRTVVAVQSAHAVHSTYDAPERRLPPITRVQSPRPRPAPNTARPAAPPEVELLELAQSALAAGDLAAAEHALARDRAVYPAGMLTEERRSLEIELDERSGDAPAAQAALATFHEDYPGSAHLARLERLLAVGR